MPDQFTEPFCTFDFTHQEYLKQLINILVLFGDSIAMQEVTPSD